MAWGRLTVDGLMLRRQTRLVNLPACNLTPWEIVPRPCPVPPLGPALGAGHTEGGAGVGSALA